MGWGGAENVGFMKLLDLLHKFFIFFLFDFSPCSGVGERRITITILSAMSIQDLKKKGGESTSLVQYTYMLV